MSTTVTTDQVVALAERETALVEAMSRARLLFARMDRNSDGTLSRSECVEFLGDSMASGMITSMDSDGDGAISLDEWLSHWSNVSKNPRLLTKYLGVVEKKVVALESVTVAVATSAGPPPLRRACSANDVPEIMERISTVFMRIDTDDSGELSKEELFVVLGSDAKVAAALADLDTNKDGTVSISEFSTWMIKNYARLGKEACFALLEAFETALDRGSAAAADDTTPPLVGLRAASAAAIPDIVARASSAFLRLDRDGNGVLDRDEVLRFVLGDAGRADAMLASIDANEDGKISLSEWHRFFIAKYAGPASGDDVLTQLAHIEAKLDAIELAALADPAAES